VLTTGVLAVLGTFLVRSGVLQSIHAFGASTLGIPFLALIGLMIIVSIVLVVTRAPQLRTEHRLDSLLSREAVFLGNNLVLVAMCFVVFWGTFFPLISKAFGSESSVGPPWFDRYTVPLALILVLLSGVGPLIAWRRASWANFRRSLLWPTLAGVAVLVVGLALIGSPVSAVAMFALAAFVIASVGQELVRGVRARRAMSGGSVPRALVVLVQRNRRRYGGYLVHAGVAVLFVGVAASSSFQHVHEVRLSPGQTAQVGAYRFTYVRPVAQLHAATNGRLEKISLGAVLRVRRGGGPPHLLTTSKDYFPSQDPTLGPVSRFFDGESTTTVGLHPGLRNDIWSAVSPDTSRLAPLIAQGDRVFTKNGRGLSAQQVNEFLAEALGGLTASYAKHPPPATFRLEISPLVSWIWIGGLIVLFGGLLAGWPSPRGATRLARAAYAARVGRDVRGARVPA
jgi:cytochrome c-type biogenesis protein CcmF